jgi:hypothetical protein
MATLDIGLISGRHPMPVSYYLWDHPVVAMDFEKMERHALEFIQKMAWDGQALAPDNVRLFVTGYTPALTSFLNMWARYGYRLGIKLTLMHWNAEVEDYIPQEWGL